MGDPFIGVPTQPEFHSVSLANPTSELHGPEELRGFDLESLGEPNQLPAGHGANLRLHLGQRLEIWILRDSATPSPHPRRSVRRCRRWVPKPAG